MISYLRELRLVPIALIASACLLVLKAADLALDGTHWLADDDAPASDTTNSPVVRISPNAPQPAVTKSSWAQQMFGFPNGAGAAPSTNIAPPPVQRASDDQANGDITGAIGTEPAAKSDSASKKDASAAAGKDAKDNKGIKMPPPGGGTVIPTDGAPIPSGAERAILERLQQRREELDTRARELDIRENLIKVAEKRMDARLAELKEVEGRIGTETQKKDDAEAARFKGLVTMYENMKPRDAAKIFDRLDNDVLIEVTSQINPRKMSDILAQMSPDTAERLTVELASKAQSVAKNSTAQLPKIQGQPTTP
jgi:flagellar motility protein MotE (MotC chaperone)